jgi:hypothetical protein
MLIVVQATPINVCWPAIMPVFERCGLPTGRTRFIESLSRDSTRHVMR